MGLVTAEKSKDEILIDLIRKKDIDNITFQDIFLECKKYDVKPDITMFKKLIRKQQYTRR